jgi:aryl-alcohol dehydrogenase-like predicted oxidoreductase
MEKRPLGRTGMDVSVICLGTMTWGQQNTEAEGHEQMDYALDQGINFFDTAELYSIPPKAETQGSTERIIGSWFKERGNRDKVILASKVVGATSMTWFRNQRKAALPTKQNVFEAVDASLKRLQTDYIDLYQLHWPGRPFSIFGTNPLVWEPAEGPEVAIEETLDAFDELGEVRQGARHRPVQRKRLGRDEMAPRRRDQRQSAHRLDPERLQYRQPHLRDRACRSGHARGCGPAGLLAARPRLSDGQIP